MKRNVLIIFLLLIADQMTKSAAAIWIPRGQYRGFFTHAVHQGTILGAFIPMLLFFILLYYTVRVVNGQTDRWPFSLSLLLAGGISNALEIVIEGYVVDWLYLGFVKTNLADLYMIAAILMFAIMVKREKHANSLL